jgi:acetylornithine deacetylase
MRFTVDRNYVTSILADLVRIDSTNPLCTDGGAGEEEIAAYVREELRGLGLEVATHEIEPGRVNVVGRLKGKGNGHSLLLNAHTDTVGVEGMTEPFSGRIDHGKLYGRGAYDTKGGLAAMIAAAKSIVDAEFVPGGDLFVAAVADEEYTSIGTIDLLENVKTDAAVVLEPTDLALCLAHRGIIWYEVETIGKAAHGSRYDVGIDANIRMGRFLAKLDDLERSLRARTPHPLVGPPSLNAGLLRGGTELSIYAARCVLQMERRIVPGETEPQTTGELQAILNELTSADPSFRATLKPLLQRSPFEIAADAAIVKSVEQATARRLGQPPRQIGQPFWTDAGLLAEAGIETTILGPIGQGLHSPEEWVDLQSVVDLTHILADTVTRYCSEDKTD